MLSLISGCILVGGDTAAQVVCKMHVLAHLHLTRVFHAQDSDMEEGVQGHIKIQGITKVHWER